MSVTQLPRLSSLLQSGHVPGSFLDFYNYGSFGNCRSDTLLTVLHKCRIYLMVPCELTTIIFWQEHQRNDAALFSHLVTWFLPVASLRVFMLIIQLRSRMLGFFTVKLLFPPFLVSKDIGKVLQNHKYSVLCPLYFHPLVLRSVGVFWGGDMVGFNFILMAAKCWFSFYTYQLAFYCKKELSFVAVYLFVRLFKSARLHVLLFYW